MNLSGIQDTIPFVRSSRHLSYGINPRIYVILRGGLGNQLHQIAAGVKFSEELGRKIVIFPYIVDTANNVDRRGFFRKINLKLLFPGASIRETNLIETIVLRLLNLMHFKYITRKLICEKSFFRPVESHFYLLRGWFQSFEYIPNQIDYLALKGLESFEADKITLHVRLTDFSTIDSNPLGSDYYFNAISLLNEQQRKFNLICFSDDIEKAQTIIPRGFNYDFPEINGLLSPPDLLSQLSSSQILICSRSSLCWWAANSVSAGGGIVISPWSDTTHKAEWLRARV